MPLFPRRPRRAPLLSLAGSLALLLASPALAILDEAAPEAPPPAAALCLNGKIWHDAGGTCVDPELGLVGDEALFAEMRRQARAGRHAEALRLLSAMRESDTPRVLAAEGYLLRRSGRVAEGLALYERALALDPDYHVARAYLGMWHLSQRDRASAMRQLAEIEARGGGGSAAWQALRAELDGDGTGY